jgi:hypothetical protein
MVSAVDSTTAALVFVLLIIIKLLVRTQNFQLHGPNTASENGDTAVQRTGFKPVKSTRQHKIVRCTISHR